LRFMTLYVLTDEQSISSERFIATVEEALLGGADMVQFREKGSSPEARLARGMALKSPCDSYGVPLIVNDDPELAYAIRATGVHLGRDDGNVRDARALLGRGAMIGVSCYDSIERALVAQKERADYVAFGAFYPSGVKPDAVHPPLLLLTEARAQLAIPNCAIGGITTATVSDVLRHGADFIAVCTAVFAAPDVRKAARMLRDTINETRDRIQQEPPPSP
jgi:thiamine-phosphate pyrophosphorylase